VPKEAAPKDAAKSTERNAAADEQHQQRVQQLEEQVAVGQTLEILRQRELAMQAQVDKSKQQIRELDRQVQEEKRKQQIQKMEARVAEIQTQHHALAFKLQVQERQKRDVIEQTLQQVLERTRRTELQLARINQGAIGKENTAPSEQTEFKDIWLVCAKPACSRTWTWTPGSQAFYKSVDKGTPKYCPGCRN